MRSTIPIKTTLIASALSLLLLIPAQADPAKDTPTQPCPVEVSGRTIAYAMMALVATDNCKDFPHTKEEIQAYIEHLKCNAKAKQIIEKIGPRYLERFDYLFYGRRIYQSCEQAKHYKPTTRGR